VIRIYREEVKPGRLPTASLRYLPTRFCQGNAPNHYIALTSITGPNEACLGAHESFARSKRAIRNKNNAALSAEIDQPGDDICLSAAADPGPLEEDLSFRPGCITMMRFLTVNTVRVRPATPNSEKPKDNQRRLREGQCRPTLRVYQVTAGAPIGTYLILSRKSLAELDAPPNQRALWVKELKKLNHELLRSPMRPFASNRYERAKRSR
jgi:hypothetical protein